MVTEGYHFFKPLRKEGGRGKALASRQAAEATGGRGGIGDLSRGCVNELGDPIDGRRGGLRFVKGAKQTKLKFWQGPRRRIRQKAERSKVVKTL